MNESIIKSGFRAFIVTLCKWFGFFCGLILLILLIDSLSGSSNELKIDNDYKVEILPNAQGIRKELDSDVPVILKLEIVGEIGKSELTAQTIRQQLVESREKALKNDRVKALLVHLNTPGGSGFDADGIYRAIKAYKKEHQVPVYGYVDGLCASGGMYVAAACDKVYSSDSSLIGNIGVITAPFFNVSRTMETYGVKGLTIYAGKDKDELDPFRPWKEHEANNIQQVIDFFYQHFVNIVVDNRPKINKEKLIQEYGAKIFSAPEAYEIGMVDSWQSSEAEVLTLLAEAIGAKDSEYQVVRFKDKNVLKSLFSSESPLLSGLCKLRLVWPGERDVEMAQQPYLLYQPQP